MVDEHFPELGRLYYGTLLGETLIFYASLF
jgi:hypothetical protein